MKYTDFLMYIIWTTYHFSSDNNSNRFHSAFTMDLWALQPSNSPIFLARMRTFLPTNIVFVCAAVVYLALVRWLRYKRTNWIASPFTYGKRPLSSMTTQEAFEIMTQLQSLEFPYAMNKARSVALLKVCRCTPALWYCR